MPDEKTICVSCNSPADVIFEPDDVDKIGTACCMPCGHIYQAILKHQERQFVMELIE